MVYGICTILMIIIEIFGTVLTYKLLRSNTMDDLLISNSVNENNINMSLSQNLENNLVKYSRG